MNDNPTRASSTVTRRAALTGLGIAGLGLASGVASRQAAAQDAAGGPNLAGSWLAIITFADGRTIVGLSTYGTDGTAVASGLPAQPAPPAPLRAWSSPVWAMGRGKRPAPTRRTSPSAICGRARRGRHSGP